MNLSSANKNRIFENNIRVENIFCMPLMTACDSVPETFWKCVDDNFESVMDALGLTEALQETSLYGEVEKKEDLENLLHDHSRNGVLIEVQSPNLMNVDFDDNGNFKSASISWGFVGTYFAYGTDLNDAIEKAIALVEQSHNSAKKKQTN